MHSEGAAASAPPSGQGEGLDGPQRDAAPRRRRRRPRLLKSGAHRAALTFKASWKEYCGSANIDGVRYFVEEGRTRFERAFWVLSLAASLCGCAYMIHKVYNKWVDSPVIVSFAERSTPIWDVPFPAVSVCPETKSRQRHFNYTDVFHRHADFLRAAARNDSSARDINEDERHKFEAVALLCDGGRFFRGNLTLAEDSMDILRQVASPRKEVFLLCTWQGDNRKPCSELFTPVMSDEGLCYTFNMLRHQELFTPAAVQFGEAEGRPSEGWNLERQYPPHASLDTYPRRALDNGADSGLEVILGTYTQDCDYLCRGAVQGFKVLLHNPAEAPRIGQQYFRTPLNQAVVVVVKPSMMTTSNGLRDYEPTRRQCFFPYERHLKYFKVYTQKNCELECSTNYTMTMCGCAAFHMPRSADIPICGTGSSRCIKNATETVIRGKIMRGLERKERRRESTTDDCHCLPACITLEYDAETSQADLAWRNFSAAARFNMTGVSPGFTVSHVSITFKDTQFITNRRSEMYGRAEFFANCGGLLGLFSGFSLISIVEIVYYFTIRLWCNVHRVHRKRSRAVAEPAAPGDVALGVVEI